MLRLFSLLLTLMLSTTLAIAQEWPNDAKMQMQAAGDRLGNAATTAERVSALREIGAIAAAHPDAEGAQVMASVLGQKATMEAGPGAMLAALEELASAGEITDVEAYSSIVGPLIDTAVKMQADGTLLPEAAIQMDDAISKLNGVAAKAGLPSVAEVISKASGDVISGAAATDLLSKLANFAKAARASPDLANMTAKETKEYLDSVVGSIPAGAGVAISGPAFIAFRDSLAWNNEMFGQSAQALDLVANAIETGQFDHEAYNKIHDRLNELSKGPWGSDTAKDMLKSLCKSIPVAGAWCDDLFKAVEELLGDVDCGAITCDCENVGGGLMRGPLIVQCRLQEENLIGECRATQKVTGTCDAGAAGSGANY